MKTTARFVYISTVNTCYLIDHTQWFMCTSNSKVRIANISDLHQTGHLSLTTILCLGFPTRFLPKPKNRVTRAFFKTENRFLAACKPGFLVLNFYLQYLITRVPILTRNNSDACSMSTRLRSRFSVPLIFGYIYH